MALPTPPTSSFSSTFKPQRPEAIARLRTNVISLLGLTVVTSLLPLPAPWTALSTVWNKESEVGGVWWGLCVLEVLVTAVLGLNILQASYALKYPLASSAVPPTLSKAKPSPISPTPQRKFTTFTPTASARQPQRPFASSLTASGYGYAPSPTSTPSRTLHYPSVPSFHASRSTFNPNASTSSTFDPDASLNSNGSFDLDSSVPSYLGSPSPAGGPPIVTSPLAAFRGKHRATVGRAFDGELLNRLARSGYGGDD